MTWLTDGTVDVPLSDSTNAEDKDTTLVVVGWEITDAPEGSTATIDPASADQLDITVTGITIAGTYQLMLSVVDDGEEFDDDTVEIRVYSDGCAASQGEAEQNITDVTGPLGVPDCIVDMYDFALLVSEWLNDVTLQ